MNTRTTARNAQTRETETREEIEWTYEEPNALEIPKPVQNRFESEGMSLRWIRINLKDGDLALAKMPAGKYQARSRYFQDKSQQLMNAVNSQLENSSDSRMPISNNSKSSVTRGRVPSFQD